MTKETGIMCPIRCGECCESYWRDIEELAAKFPDSYWGPCPHQKDTGCELPREERPEGCNEHLCDKAEAVLYPNPITLKILKGILARVESEEKEYANRRSTRFPRADSTSVQTLELPGVHPRVQTPSE